jgi:hypothetical protein
MTPEARSKLKKGDRVYRVPYPSLRGTVRWVQPGGGSFGVIWDHLDGEWGYRVDDEASFSVIPPLMQLAEQA